MKAFMLHHVFLALHMKGTTVIPTQPYKLNDVRKAFPIAERLTYLNHASIAPMPRPAADAMQRAIATLSNDPMAFFMPRPGDPDGDIFVTFSVEMARMINAAHMHEVVGITSTSSGLNAIAQAIDWQPGDNVILVDVEFRGVECRLASADRGGASIEAFDALVDARTRVIAVSAIQFLAGHRTDLAALGAYCRERGILFVVDAIQAAGHMPIDVQAMQIDVLASGGQKSLMGPPGQGFLYVRDAVCERLRPGIVGPNATDGWEHWVKYDLTPREGAFRFMMGTPNIAGMVGLVASVRFLRQIGLERIDAWTKHLSQLAIADLQAHGYHVITPTDPALLGPIVTFRVGDPDNIPAAEAEATALLNHLMRNGIRVTKHWDAHRRPHVRISTHCYNTADEVHRVCATLEEHHD